MVSMWKLKKRQSNQIRKYCKTNLNIFILKMKNQIAHNGKYQDNILFNLCYGTCIMLRNFISKKCLAFI